MEIIAYVEDIGTLTTVDGKPEFIRCNPTGDPRSVPSLLPCYFNSEQLVMVVQRYKGFVELLEKGLKYYSGCKAQQ